jgi:hypothetical protein
MKSSRRIVPGWTGGKSASLRLLPAVAVDDLDILRVAL